MSNTDPALKGNSHETFNDYLSMIDSDLREIQATDERTTLLTKRILHTAEYLTNRGEPFLVFPYCLDEAFSAELYEGASLTSTDPKVFKANSMIVGEGVAVFSDTKADTWLGIKGGYTFEIRPVVSEEEQADIIAKLERKTELIHTIQKATETVDDKPAGLTTYSIEQLEYKLHELWLRGLYKPADS
jgi:hypothetical protein